MEKVTCGTCRLHGSHFYGNSENGWVGAHLESTCCADTAMDLPDSWSNNTVMDPVKERYCPVHQPVDHTGATSED